MQFDPLPTPQNEREREKREKEGGRAGGAEKGEIRRFR